MLRAVRVLERLFSTFADGWPGRGLLVQRLLTGGALVYRGVGLRDRESDLRGSRATQKGVLFCQVLS